jgi:cyclase
MTLKKRIIPIIYYSGTNQIQSVGFNRPHRVIGDLMSAVRVMERRQVDELILIDVDASITNQKPNFKLIEKLANEIYCPFTVGGGVSCYNDVRDLLLCGADKIALQTLCYADPAEAIKIINKVGKQSVVMSVDLKGDSSIDQHINLIHYIDPGEVLLTSKAHNGTMQGYDLEPIWEVASRVGCPVIANGGAGHPDHFAEALDDAQGAAHAVAASSIFLFTDWTPRSAAKYLKEKKNIEVRV